MPYKDPEIKKAKHKDYSREHYLRNQAEIKKKTAEKNAANKAEWDVFKRTLKCTKCGFSHTAALDFHHINPEEKENAVNRLISNKSFVKAYEEIKKCIVLCANCHRIHHYEENKKVSRTGNSE
jgi:hypothetical protein